MEELHTRCVNAASAVVGVEVEGGGWGWRSVMSQKKRFKYDDYQKESSHFL